MCKISFPKYGPAFEAAINFVMPAECVFKKGHYGDYNFVITENVPGDSGGLTKFGIDQNSNPGVDIASLTLAQAIEIYHAKYWLPHNLDALPEKLAICCFDVWVNGGYATLWLQHSINKANALTHGAQIGEDGVMGAQTIGAAKAVDQPEVIKDYLALRDARFSALAVKYANDKQFLKGWLNRDQELFQYLTALPNPAVPD